MPNMRGQLIQIGTITPGTTKTKNAIFFGVNLATLSDGVNGTWWIISLAFSAPQIIQYTIDGTNWIPLNSGAAFQSQNYTFPNTVGSVLNFRCIDNAGCTVLLADVSESGGP